MKCVDRAQFLEQAFCQDFSCCGKRLKSLHDLLEHFETFHVRLEEEEEAAAGIVENHEGKSNFIHGGELMHSRPLIAPKILSPTERNLSQLPIAFKRRIDTDYSDGGFDGYSAFDDAIVKKQKLDLVDGSSTDEDVDNDGGNNNNTNSSNNFNFISANGAGSAAGHSIHNRNNTGIIKHMLVNYTVAPALLSSSDDDDQLEFEIDPEYAYLKYMKQLKSSAGYTGGSHGNRRNSVYHSDAIIGGVGDRKERKYQCLVPGCSKNYRNQNGLKYHIEHSHSVSEQDLAERLMRAIREDPVEKPFACSIPGCTKRYRNSNGLKYHLLHHHSPGGCSSPQSPCSSAHFAVAFPHDEMS